ncbi:MAG: hypothetical protein OXG62_03025, partial [Nitrospinae bacterium]|nr:hypothetical protein [Nitrospinota bacterium]
IPQSFPYGVVEKVSLRLGLTFAFARHSGVRPDQCGRVRHRNDGGFPASRDFFIGLSPREARPDKWPLKNLRRFPVTAEGGEFPGKSRFGAQVSTRGVDFLHSDNFYYQKI